MTNCYICDVYLDETNKSKEHIILNAIGGKLKSTELLCNVCNSKLGYQADSELAKQLLFISSYLQIKRDSGTFPIIKGLKTSDGKSYDLLDGSKPILSKPNVEIKEGEKTIDISISARNEKELFNILKGIQKKFPTLDIDRLKETAELKEGYLDDFLTHRMTIGGELAFQSIAKTAINYYLLARKEKSSVEHLINYLLNKEKLKIVNHYYPNKRPYKREPKEIVHLIHLCGNKHDNLLYCYIEFFSTFSFLVILNENYYLKSFSQTYCFDIMTNKEINRVVNLKLNKEQISIALNSYGLDFKKVGVEMNRIMEIGNKLQISKTISEMTTKSVENIFAIKYGDEKRVTEIMCKELAEEISMSFVKFLLREPKLNSL